MIHDPLRTDQLGQVRIFYLAPSMLISDSANSVHVMNMSQALCQQGYHLHLLASQGYGNKDDIDRYYGITSPFQITRFDEANASAARIVAKLKRWCKLIKTGGLLSILYGWQTIRPFLARHHCDLIYARHPYWLFAVRNLAPYRYESHRIPANRLDQIVERKILTHPNCQRLIVISEAARLGYRSLFPGLETPITVAPDGANDPCTQGHEFDVMKDEPGIGYVGHLYQGRGLGIIIALARAFPGLPFHIAGGTADDIQRLHQMDPPDNVTIYGHLPPAKLHTVFARFTIALAPYQKRVAVMGNLGNSASIMSPLKIFEYMAWQKAILCSDLPVLHEVLHHGKNSWLVPPDDLDGWISALSRLLDDAELRRKLAASARSDFLQHYSWKARANTVLEGLEITSA